MEKRLVLATALSVLILLTWSVMLPKKPVSITPLSTKAEPAKPQALSLPTLAEQEPTPASLLSYNQPEFEISFVEPQAAIKEAVFKSYNTYKFLLSRGFALAEKNLAFKKQSMTAEAITFVQTDQNKEIIKRFIFHSSNYTIDLEINVQNESAGPLLINYPLSLGILDFKKDPDAARFRDVAVATLSNGLLRTTHLNGRKDMILEQPKFVALRDRYFCNIVEPLTKGHSVLIKKLNPHETEISLIPEETILAPGETFKQKFRIYLGPQDLRMIKAVNPAWASVVNYGFFDFISQLLLRLLEFFHAIVHNWGWAIIILSIAVYLILFPLTLKQMRSMKEMQMLQPRIEELKKMYKDNPQKLHKETLELYREHKVNPFGGCLPLLLQMPIFFALYQALARSIVLKGAHFLWVKDLSEPDRLFLLPVYLPVISNEINILPILMAVVMFFQQKTSLATASSEHAEQQKIMLIAMPILFGFIFYRMPAGLVLYWFVNSLLMAAYQFKMNKAK